MAPSAASADGGNHSHTHTYELKGPAVADPTPIIGMAVFMTALITLLWLRPKKIRKKEKRQNPKINYIKR